MGLVRDRSYHSMAKVGRISHTPVTIVVRNSKGSFLWPARTVHRGIKLSIASMI